MILKILLPAILIVLVAFLGLSIRMLLKKKGTFHGGSCAHITPELKNHGISCACGTESECSNDLS